MPLRDMQTDKYDGEADILVVDDDSTLLKFFKIHLNKFFSKVIVVKSAQEAMQTCKDRHIDLVISDLRMPRVDGLQLMKKVRKKDPTIPFLLVSGAVGETTDEQLAEADGFLSKPFDVDELHNFIAQGLVKRQQIKDLETLLNPDKIIKVLLEKITLEKALKNPESLQEAQNLFDKIQRKPNLQEEAS
ncbi:MAG: response regulator [Oligoflexales bacterium]